jgi:enoyl-CoA hydratase
MASVLTIDDIGPARVLTLNRPEARNALSRELVVALYDALRQADADPGVRAVVLTGADPAFCAGVDLKEAARDGERYFDVYSTHDCIGQVAAMRIPVIGAVNGPVFTGGLEIALGCDFLVGSPEAVFADTHVRVGVLPRGGLTARLPMFVGAARARRMSMTGEIVDAAEALRAGLLTEVVPHERLRARAAELAARTAEAEPCMMLAIKQAYVEGAAAVVGPALAAERRVADENPPDYGGIDDRRRQVTARNRDLLPGRRHDRGSH